METIFVTQKLMEQKQSKQRLCNAANIYDVDSTYTHFLHSIKRANVENNIHFLHMEGSSRVNTNKTKKAY